MEFTSLDGTSSLIGQRATEIFVGGEKRYNSQSEYRILKRDDTHDVLASINFQKGPIAEVGINGVFMEDLLNIVANQLEQFQQSEYATRENAVALTKVQEALMWLKKRTEDRSIRGVLGTYQK